MATSIAVDTGNPEQTTKRRNDLKRVRHILTKKRWFATAIAMVCNINRRCFDAICYKRGRDG